MLTYAGGGVLLQTMDARDTLPHQRYIYELELSYSFEQTEKEALKVLLSSSSSSSCCCYRQCELH
jgi:hypothetical protein